MWTIHLIVNTVEINDECAVELQKWYDEEFDDDHQIVVNGKIDFNVDHSEHRNYVTQYKKFCDILLNHKVNGMICWFDGEGSEHYVLYGYSFAKGIPLPLKGRVDWTVNL